jgi:hypothetical protein
MPRIPITHRSQDAKNAAILAEYEKTGCTQEQLGELWGITSRQVRRRLRVAKANRLVELRGTDAEVGHIELYQSSNQRRHDAKQRAINCDHPRRITIPGMAAYCLDCGASGIADLLRQDPPLPDDRRYKPKRDPQPTRRERRKALAKHG